MTTTVENGCSHRYTEMMNFSSSLLNPENLRLVSESGDCAALVGRVCSRQKPMAFVDGGRKRPLVDLEDVARRAGLATRLHRYVFTCGPRPVISYFLSVAITDVIGEAVDVEALAREYSRWFSGEAGLVARIAAELERLRPMRFPDFLDFGDAEVRSASVHEYARTGLLFGYPVESTCRLMERMLRERRTAMR